MTPLERIAAYARRTAHDARRPGREAWAHNSFHDLVLAHGRVFEPAPLPENIYPALPGHCSKAATILADQHALTYVEGLVLLPDTRTVTEHAWCTTWSGQVIDPSLGGDTGLAYLGIAFTTAFRRQAAARPGGRWSVLTADRDGGSAQNLELSRTYSPRSATTWACRRRAHYDRNCTHCWSTNAASSSSRIRTQKNTTAWSRPSSWCSRTGIPAANWSSARAKRKWKCAGTTTISCSPPSTPTPTTK